MCIIPNITTSVNIPWYNVAYKAYSTHNSKQEVLKNQLHQNFLQFSLLMNHQKLALFYRRKKGCLY